MFKRSFKDEFIHRHGAWPGVSSERVDQSMEALMDLAAERMEGYAEEVARLRVDLEEYKKLRGPTTWGFYD